MISEDHDDMRHNKSCDERREKQPLLMYEFGYFACIFSYTSIIINRSKIVKVSMHVLRLSAGDDNLCG